MKRKKRTTALTIGVTTTFVLVAALAGAAGKISVATKTLNIPLDSNVAGRAQCEGKQKSLAGGFAMIGPESEGGYIKTTKRDKRRGWQVGMYADEDADNVKVFAYCRNDQGLANGSENELLDDNADKEIVAACPQGTKAISGGTLTPASSNAYPYSSFRKGQRRWTTEWISLADDSPATTTVVCRDGAGLQEAKKTKTVTDPDFENRFSVVAECPAGSRVLSGGWESSVPVNKGVSFVSASRRVSKRKWKVAFNTTASQQMTAYAYCESV
jgi:hypothetical protein